MDINSTKTVAAAIVVTVIGAELFLVLPVLVGAVAETFGLDESQVGWIGSAAMSGAAVSAALAVFWVRRIGWRHIAMAGLSLLALGNLLALMAPSFGVVIGGLIVASLGGGTAYSLAITVLSDTDNPDRAFGLSITAQVAFQVAGLMGLPLLIAVGGLDALFAFFVLLPVLGMIAVRWVPARGKSIATTGIIEVVSQPKVVLALLGCLLFFFNVGIFWTYIERIASAEGFAPARIGLGLAIGVSAGMAGSMHAAWLGECYGRLRALIWGAVGTVIAAAALYQGMNFWVFVLAVALYNYFWNFSLAYQYAVVAAVDRTGRAVAVAPAFHAIGATLGPAIATVFVTENSFVAVNILVVVSVSLSLVAFIPTIYQKAVAQT